MIMTSGTENTGLLNSFLRTQIGRNLILGSAISLILAIIVSIFLWSNRPEYRVLFSNYSDRDGGSIIAALQQLNIPYEFSEAGNAILVPAERVHDARLKLATQGLPKGGNSGFELMENQKLGASQFLEQVNFQRALEGELSRSIDSIDAVLASRIHLAIPKPTVFVRDKQKPTASVLLNLRPGRVLDRQQVSGIIHLVSSSVPELGPENVTIIDQNGNLLSDLESNSKTNQLDPTQLKYVQDLQGDIVRKIESILTPILGVENLRAEATAEIDFSTSEQAAEIYKPNNKPEDAAKRSEHIKSSSSSDVNKNGAVAGAASNQIGRLNEPQVLEQLGIPNNPNAVDESQNNQEQETINHYEVDKTVKYIQNPRGNIKRLTVAVVINNKTDIDVNNKNFTRPLTEEEKNQIANLVKEAMGFKAERGDSVSIVNIPFKPMEKQELTIQPFWHELITVENFKNLVQYLISLFAIYYLTFYVLKPLLKRLSTATQNIQAQASESEVPKPDISSETPRPETDLEIARRKAQENPRIIATVIKNWLNEE
ncbi:MAG: flagellar basal body M-ring protein FliF [Pseudomonadota bacterium]|jgi:flagellar M-ring protein FliF